MTRWGVAGVLAGFAAAVGRGQGEAAYRLVQAETCSLDIVANVRLGPSEGAILQGSVPGELRGEIAFALDPEGRIDGGTWRLEGGGELAVSGQATGQALTLRVQAGIGQTIVLTGAGEEDFAVCTGAADGLFTGPQRGDIGDWHAIATSLGAPQATTPPAPGVTSTPIPTTAVPTATAGVSPTATASPAPGTATVTATATATATTTATPTATATPEATATPTPTPTPEPTATATPLPDPCPSGTVTCSGVCMDLLNDPANCGACGNACTFGICVAGECTFLQACLSPQVFCGDVCVDLQTNPAHCGACGNACFVTETCSGGECQPGVLAPAD